MTAAAATTAEQISPAEPLVHLLIDREGIVLVEPWVGGELHHSLGDNSTALCTHFLFFHSIVCCLFVFFLFPFPPQLVPTEMELTCRPSLDYHLIVLIILSQIAINVFITMLTDAALISSVLVLRVVILCRCCCCQLIWVSCLPVAGCSIYAGKEGESSFTFSFAFFSARLWPGLVFNSVLISFECMPSRSVALLLLLYSCWLEVAIMHWTNIPRFYELWHGNLFVYLFGAHRQCAMCQDGDAAVIAAATSPLPAISLSCSTPSSAAANCRCNLSLWSQDGQKWVAFLYSLCHLFEVNI